MRTGGISTEPTVTIKGLSWTTESLVIAALVRRLGGDVVISNDELKPEGGLVASISKDHKNRLRLEVIEDKVKKKCYFIFKSLICGYCGPEVRCDHTFERCVELGNESRFPCDLGHKSNSDDRICPACGSVTNRYRHPGSKVWCPACGRIIREEG